MPDLCKLPKSDHKKLVEKHRLLQDKHYRLHGEIQRHRNRADQLEYELKKVQTELTSLYKKYNFEGNERH